MLVVGYDHYIFCRLMFDAFVLILCNSDRNIVKQFAVSHLVWMYLKGFLVGTVFSWIETASLCSGRGYPDLVVYLVVRQLYSMQLQFYRLISSWLHFCPQ